jgi:excisionase family DNA binding protein
MERNAPTPDIFEAVVTAFADTLIRSYHERWNRGGIDAAVKETAAVATTSPWLTVDEAAAHAQCGTRMLYREVQAKRLRAVRVGGRRSLRFRAERVDAWLEAASRV